MVAALEQVGVTIRGPMATKLWLPIVERRWGDIPPELCFWGGAGTGKSFTLMLIFVLLMVAYAEQFGFGWAYLLASGAILA